MCGIAGILHFDSAKKADQTILKRMTDSITHRGPDAEGFYIIDNLGLGHRRLSIIDLNTGAQPMVFEEAELSISFNGEIYNYIELKEELTSLGHQFKTTSDTEVILHAYQQWGVDFQNKLNGMWAFALWDAKKGQLLLSRDRIGEKPLYYSSYQNSIIFGSEIKCLFAYGCPNKPNLEFLDIYLRLGGFIPAPHTFYKDIFQLPPGHFLIIKDNNIQEHTYWDIPQISEAEMLNDKEKIHSEFEALFHDAVKIRMRSDVPFGAFLSGGLDSSSVVASMSEISDYPVKTFTIGFQDKAFDERHLAQDVANKFNTEHHVQLVEPESFESSLTKVLHHYDEPFGDSSAIPTGYVSKHAREHVKMVLTGDGGDEVLSGYNMYQAEKFAAYFQFFPSLMQSFSINTINGLSKLFSGNKRYFLNKINKLFYLSSLDFKSRLIKKSSWALPSLIPETSSYFSSEDYISQIMQKCHYKDPFYKLMYYQLKISLPGDMLTKVDRMSMAHSIETRVPFLDHRLIELMVKVSKNVKMNGFERKSILRKTIGKKLPDSILHAPKKGFSVPLREWFKDKSFENKLDDLTQSDFGLNNKAIKQLIQKNKEGKEDHGNMIWMLFILQKWLSKY